MLSEFRIVLVPHGLKLLLFFAIFVNLSFEFSNQFFHGALQLLYLGLLEVKHFLFACTCLVFVDFLGCHLVDLLSEFVKLGLSQGDLLSTVPLLLLEFDRLLLRLLHLLAPNHTRGGILHKACRKHASHRLLLWKGRVLGELLVDGLDNSSQARLLGIPALDRRSLVLDSNWVEGDVGHSGHHVDLRGHLRESCVQSDFDVEGCGRNCKL